jgi:hypothetical protein
MQRFVALLKASAVWPTLALILAGPISCTKDQAATTATEAHPGHHHAAMHDHGTAGHDHAAGTHDSSAHAAEDAVTAKNYADAVKQIQSRMASLDAIIKSGDYDAVHKDCVAIGKLGESIGDLAAAQDSGVPKDEVESLRDAGKELAAAQKGLHKAAHGDDLATVKEQYVRMGKLLESLANYAPR